MIYKVSSTCPAQNKHSVSVNYLVLIQLFISFLVFWNINLNNSKVDEVKSEIPPISLSRGRNYHWQFVAGFSPDFFLYICKYIKVHSSLYIWCGLFLNKNEIMYYILFCNLLFPHCNIQRVFLSVHVALYMWFSK